MTSNSALLTDALGLRLRRAHRAAKREREIARNNGKRRSSQRKVA